MSTERHLKSAVNSAGPVVGEMSVALELRRPIPRDKAESWARDLKMAAAQIEALMSSNRVD